MGREKLTNPNLTINEMVMIMSEGNPGAIFILAELLKNPNGILQVLSLDSLDIRGSKLWMLYKDCCDCDMDKFKKTIKILNSGVFTFDEIHNNLSMITAIPFIDDAISIDWKNIDFDKREAAFKAQKESFTKRLNKALEFDNKLKNYISNDSKSK